MKKVFILPQFGTPHSWTQQFIDHIQNQERYGWYFKIFTPNPFQTKGNVEIISMNVDQFNELVARKLGVDPGMTINILGKPSFHMTDFNVFLGSIFEDYIKDYKYWGCLGWDTVLGRLDHFIPDNELENYDVWSDDTGVINGTFCLFRNIKMINDLPKRIVDWQKKLIQNTCPACTGVGQTHTLYGTDEYDFTEVMQHYQSWFGHPKYYPVHGHDRLKNHQIELKEDGSLWELNPDTPPDWKYKHMNFGREIAYFHFMLSKKWAI